MGPWFEMRAMVSTVLGGKPGCHRSSFEKDCGSLRGFSCTAAIERWLQARFPRPLLAGQEPESAEIPAPGQRFGMGRRPHPAWDRSPTMMNFSIVAHGLSVARLATAIGQGRSRGVRGSGGDDAGLP